MTNIDLNVPQNADFMTMCETAEPYMETIFDNDVEVSMANKLFIKAAHAAINHSINKFLGVIQSEKSLLAKAIEITGKEATAETLATLEDLMSPTEMEAYNGQKQELVKRRHEACLAAMIYNTIARDLSDMTSSYNRPMTAIGMLEIRTREEAPPSETLIEAKAKEFNKPIAYVRTLFKNAPPNEFRTALIEHKDEILRRIDSASVLYGNEEFPVMMQLQLVLKMVKSLVSKAYEYEAKTFDKMIIARAGSDAMKRAKEAHQRALVAMQFDLHECKRLQAFSNRLLRDNAADMLDLEASGTDLPVIDIQQLIEDAKTRMEEKINEQIKAAEKMAA